jgi:hypothetical protein
LPGFSRFHPWTLLERLPITLVHVLSSTAEDAMRRCRLPLLALSGILLLGPSVSAQRFFRSSTSASSTPVATSTPPSATTSYNIKVFYRNRGASDWRTYGLYLADPGMRLAQHLQDQGYEVYAQRTQEPLYRNPLRPAERLLPVGQTATLPQVEAAFQALLKREEIAYHFPADGCYARTHLMSKYLQQMGLHPWKIWAFANGHDLQVPTSHHPAGEVTWEYHVAPMLRVRSGLANQHWYVLDPALFDRPVTLEQWETALDRSPYGLKPNLTITRLGEPVSRPLDKPAAGSGYWPAADPTEGPDAHALATMRRFKPHENRWPPAGFPGALGWHGAAPLLPARDRVEPAAALQIR